MRVDVQHGWTMPVACVRIENRERHGVIAAQGEHTAAPGEHAIDAIANPADRLLRGCADVHVSAVHEASLRSRLGEVHSVFGPAVRRRRPECVTDRGGTARRAPKKRRRAVPRDPGEDDS